MEILATYYGTTYYDYRGKLYGIIIDDDHCRKHHSRTKGVIAGAGYHEEETHPLPTELTVFERQFIVSREHKESNLVTDDNVVLTINRLSGRSYQLNNNNLTHED